MVGDTEDNRYYFLVSIQNIYLQKSYQQFFSLNYSQVKANERVFEKLYFD